MNTFHHDTPRDDATQQRPATVALPTTIPAYLAQLRRALEGADPALAQDALYDAEEYLRAELAENPGRSEAEVIAAVGAKLEGARIDRTDGLRVATADGWWLLRASGTEPKLTARAEARDEAGLERLRAELFDRLRAAGLDL